MGFAAAPMVSKWVTIYHQKGLEGLLTREDVRQQRLAGADREMLEGVEALRLENAILEQKIDILKKTPASTSGTSRIGRSPG